MNFMVSVFAISDIAGTLIVHMHSILFSILLDSSGSTAVIKKYEFDLILTE